MTEAKVLVLSNLPGDGLRRLHEHCRVTVDPGIGRAGAELAGKIGGFHGLLPLLTHTVDRQVFESSDRLRVVANLAVGVDNIDLEAAAERDVVVTHTPDVLTDDTADLTWALLLGLVRRVAEADAYVRQGRFQGWRPDLFLGGALSEMTLGIVGAGRIGRAVLERASAFGMKRLYTSRRRLEPDVERALGAEWSELQDLLAAADVVSLHVALNDSTRHLLDRRALRRMRRGSFLVNTSRGAVVDEAELVDLLAAGRLAGAALDVFEREPEVDPRLLTMSQVVLTPHIGSATRSTRARMADAAVDDLLAVLVEGRVPERAVGPR
jgi:glyoxylate reductase